MANANQFLQSEPRLLREYNGAKYVPIIVVKEDLNELCGTDGDWNTSDLKSNVYEANGFCFITGSLVLYVNYAGKRRFFVGSATIHLTGNSNLHYEATLQSECIKNAAKNLGRRFGMYLNDTFEDYIGQNETKFTKVKATAIEEKQLQKALKDNDTDKVIHLTSNYEFTRNTN